MLGESCWSLLWSWGDACALQLGRVLHHSPCPSTPLLVSISHIPFGEAVAPDDLTTLIHLISSNKFLTDKGIRLPKATSTGTTIVGCVFRDGVILGADTRATEGPVVADKNCEKVHLAVLYP
jgi:hypothetical protein